MKKFKATEKHEAFYQELVALLGKHTADLPAEVMLGIAANCVGKIMAYQDQRTMTVDRAMAIVIENIEEGNRQALAELMSPKGSG